MSQVDVDNKNPSTAKRARTDGGHREEDGWTCPGCGNVNLSSRKTCNMHNCTQPRPADPNVVPALRPKQPPKPKTSNPRQGFKLPPCAVYLGSKPHPSSIYPPYGCPYRPMPLYGPPPPLAPPPPPLAPPPPPPLAPPPPPPPPFSGGAIMGNGGINGVLSPPEGPRQVLLQNDKSQKKGGINGVLPPPECPRPVLLQNDKSQKKGGINGVLPPPEGPRPVLLQNDKSQKKGGINGVLPPPEGPRPVLLQNDKSQKKGGINGVLPPPEGPRPGLLQDDESKKKGVSHNNEWTCPNCGLVNLSFRKNCYRKKCRKPKPDAQPSNPEQNSIDNIPDDSWKCKQCGNLNFSFRTKCITKNCGSNKPSEEKVPDGSWKCKPSPLNKVTKINSRNFYGAGKVV